MEIPISIAIGLQKSVDFPNPTQTVGLFVRWYEIIAFTGVVFAISEFMERTKLRIYIFKISDLSKDILQLVLLSIGSVIFANILPLFNSGSFSTPLLSYPAFWEILSLSFSTLAIILFLFFALLPHKFIPKINYRNCRSFYWAIYNRLLNDNSHEGLAAIAAIVRENLGVIFENASKYDKWWNVQGSNYSNPYEMHRVPKKCRDLVKCSRDLIDRVLSTKEFCQYLSCNNLGLVLQIIENTNKYSLGHSCGYVFYNSLCRELFMQSDSHLSKELEFRGQGLQKPIFNALFKSLSIIDDYRIFDSCSLWDERNITSVVMQKYVEGLNISIEEYISQHGYGSVLEGGPGGNTLYFALERLPHALRTIFLRLKKVEEDEIYFNKYEDIIRSIANFYGSGNLETMLSKIQKEESGYKERELEVAKYSLIGGICNSIFEYLDSLVMLKHDDYARFLSTEVFWAILPVVEKRSQILQDIENNLFEMIKERIEENKKGHYSPFIRLMVNVYGFQFHNSFEKRDVKIGRYIQEQFNAFFADKILDEEESCEKYLPKDCSIDKANGIIKDCNGYVMYKRVKR